MILSSEQGRLSERITKFLVTQVTSNVIIINTHRAVVLDPGGLEALAQQEHCPLRSETRKRTPLLRLRFPPGHNHPLSSSFRKRIYL